VTAGDWVNRELYPFESRFLDLTACRIHYIDEGAGPVILFLHGNPTWSFLYRNVIAGLQGRFRCIALDYPGFGLSTARPGYGFSPAEHTELVERFISALDLRELVVMGQDWGGPIGLAAAARQSARVSGLVIANTFAWPLGGRPFFQFFSRFVGGPLGRALVERYNAFVELSMPIGTNRTRVSDAAMEHYRRPFVEPRSRAPICELARQLLAGREYLREVECGLQRLCGLPALIVWGTRDLAFRAAARHRFERAFPNHHTVILRGVGHYVQEDAAGEVADAIATWHLGLTRAPGPARHDPAAV
jgi:haloalkane dehalogenase